MNKNYKICMAHKKNILFTSKSALIGLNLINLELIKESIKNNFN